MTHQLSLPELAIRQCNSANPAPFDITPPVLSLLRCVSGHNPSVPFWVPAIGVRLIAGSRASGAARSTGDQPGISNPDSRYSAHGTIATHCGNKPIRPHSDLTVQREPDRHRTLLAAGNVQARWRWKLRNGGVRMRRVHQIKQSPYRLLWGTFISPDHDFGREDVHRAPVSAPWP